MPTTPSTGWRLIDPGWQSVHIDSAQRIGGSFVLGFNGLAGSSYSIQYKAISGAGNWTRVTNLGPLASSGPQQVTHSQASSNNFLPSGQPFATLSAAILIMAAGTPGEGTRLHDPKKRNISTNVGRVPSPGALKPVIRSIAA